MKKILLILSSLFFLMGYPLNSQGLLNKVKKTVTKEIIGGNASYSSKSPSKPGPEPACACDNASLIIDLGIYKIDYREISLITKDDGSILIKERLGNKYYVVNDGKTQGPFEKDDQQVKEFESANEETESDQKTDIWIKKYPGYITRSGDKFLIKFNGKSYGPYALISDFAVARSKDKFAAVVTKDVMITEDQNKKMEEEMAKAKTDQERMDIAMKFSQQMSARMMQGGGVPSLQPELISNIAGAKYDPVNWMGGSLNDKVKPGDIVVIGPDKIIDLQGNLVVKLNPGAYGTKDLFVSSSNARYATYNYGTLTFSDKTVIAEIFSPYLTYSNGQISLTYMYYSPGKNAIMQCSIPF